MTYNLRMVPSIRKKENFHIFLWLIKDLCWVSLSKTGNGHDLANRWPSPLYCLSKQERPCGTSSQSCCQFLDYSKLNMDDWGILLSRPDQTIGNCLFYNRFIDDGSVLQRNRLEFF